MVLKDIGANRVCGQVLIVHEAPEVELWNAEKDK